MEKLRKLVNEIAYSHDHAKLTSVHRSLTPVLSFASSLYKLVLSIRHYLYHFGLFRKHRLPVPVISVGNLTWGGNGKTPMVEFISLLLADSGISPLILTRGYAGGDEVKMLQRHLLGKPAKFGIGANRVDVAGLFFQKYGYVDLQNSTCIEKQCRDRKVQKYTDSEKVGVIVLDDGMQHWKLWRDLEIVMINGLTLWGNLQLLPLGPLREPLTALRRADAVVIHHADLVSQHRLREMESTIKEVEDSLPIFFTRMNPSYFFEVGTMDCKIPLQALHNAIVLCVSAIGSADAFVQGMLKIGAVHVDRLDFSDHHVFHARDINIIRTRLGELEDKRGSKPIVVVTEKDYDRDPKILEQLYPYKVLVLCSELKVIPYRGNTEESFKKLLKHQLKIELPGAN
ncbi:Tetraacyldisaccharide 4'-kinase [Quillaja saponaria]|uniref:tetraacyldisaccharide 4'-kinase n=1 Tax=Quillaja saponaria TaxID=32244 RepID=A0AAD7LMP6_QUISA|nr:Tetraacyldisaccharide 4'-kinase [Quillaja saponaria]